MWFLAELKVQQTILIFKEMYLPMYKRLVEGLFYGKTIKKAIGGSEFWVTMETMESNIMTKLSGYSSWFSLSLQT